MPGTLDEQFLAPRYRGDVQVFFATGAVSGQGYQVWRKPRGCSMVCIFAVGGGGGGGGGFQAAAGLARGGGGGGGCSGITRFFGPAILLPETLFVQVGAGGQGGAGGTGPVAGAAATNSYVLTQAVTTAPSNPGVIVGSNANAPGGGAAGSAAGGAAGGTVPTISTTQSMDVWGMWFSSVGLVGAAGGGLGAAGVAVVCWAALPVSPGAGGGSIALSGADQAGGAQTATFAFDVSNEMHFLGTAGGVVAGGAAGGGNAGGGITRITPFMNAGGAGGGTSDVGVAGDGGKGGYGCGGGGGGGGATAGKGGNGGDGLVIITAW